MSGAWGEGLKIYNQSCCYWRCDQRWRRGYSIISAHAWCCPLLEQEFKAPVTKEPHERERLLQIPELLSIQMSLRFNIARKLTQIITALMLDFASRSSTRTSDGDRVWKADSRSNKTKMWFTHRRTKGWERMCFTVITMVLKQMQQHAADVSEAHYSKVCTQLHCVFSSVVSGVFFILAFNA